MNAPVLAVDVGGSSVKLGIVADGHLMARATCPGWPGREFAATLSEIGEQLAALARQVGVVWGTVCILGRVEVVIMSMFIIRLADRSYDGRMLGVSCVNIQA